jgi:predicted lactoylglutathione lyase
MTCARPADHRGFACPVLVVLGMFLGITSAGSFHDLDGHIWEIIWMDPKTGK